MKEWDLIVIGGGPAGLMGAGQAAQLGARVLLVEKMDSPGRKLLLTGKNRCNLTNSDRVQEFLDHFNPSGRFLTQLFYRFFNQELRTFFHDLGVPTVEQRGGRVFPRSENSRDVVDALINWVNQQGVEIWTQCPAEDLLLEDDQVQGVVTSRKTIPASRVLIAAGGKAYPGTGSAGDGYQLAAQAGHTIIPVRPALVPLETKGDTAQKLQGLSLKNVTLNIWVEGKKVFDLFGEMLFTHFGVSGPAILTMSRDIVDYLQDGKQVILAIDLKPALDHPTLDDRLLREVDQLGRKQFSSLLEELLPKSLIPICVEQTGIPWDRVNNQLTAEERKRLRMWLKEDFRFEISGDRSFNQAIVTAGGVDIREVDPHTMESKLAAGLYFAGEVLDVDADTGGYNLQAAFSTGWAAGRSAGQSTLQEGPDNSPNS